MVQVCLHGHFYQPPREDPWSGAIERQPSAAPYQDWNERVTAEAYAPNAAASILAADGGPQASVNNYASMSFNFGPTLLAWLEEHANETYRAIVAADRLSAERFGGHGSAMAQSYGHSILPLDSPRDRVTQVRWGLADFRHRFGREPLGIWLPETAVDLATLEVVAEHGIRYTILAPHQGVANSGSGQPVDPRRPYRVELGGGRDIVVFFYDGAISHAIAFGDLLRSGDALAAALKAAGATRPEHPPGDGAGAAGAVGPVTNEDASRLDPASSPNLVSAATDGETYGHHHRFGEMALAWAVQKLEADPEVRLTNFAEYLSQYSVSQRATIVANTSWSCVHGVERWRSDCGCQAGRGDGWHRGWRGPLRAAFDWLRDELATVYESSAGPLLRDPWRARDEYIEVILDPSGGARRAYLGRHAHPGASDEAIWRLLEMQRFGLLMFTSCGWFFDDVAGIETTQVIRYAGRAVQLAEQAGATALEKQLLSRLALAEGNTEDFPTAAALYKGMVPAGRVCG